MNDDLRGRLIAQAMWTEMEKIAGWSKGAEVIQDEEGSPVAKVLGASIEKLDERTAHGVPIVEPPPGFVYDPSLSAFVPNSEDPGWMTQPEAMQAQETAAAYQAGAQTAQQSGAQAEADQQATQALQNMQMQMPQVPDQAGAQGGQEVQAAPAPPTPKQISGLHPMAQPEGSNQPPMTKIQPPGPKSATSVAR